MTYSELKEALAVFGWSESDILTMSQFKQRHRDLVKASHPDLKGVDSSREMQRINAAAEVVQSYLDNYRFSFSEDTFYSQNPEERLRMQFANDPVWGGN